MSSDADWKGWHLWKRNGQIDTSLVTLFEGTFLANERQVETVAGLDTPELWDPDWKMVAKGQEDITNQLNRIRESQHR